MVDVGRWSVYRVIISLWMIDWDRNKAIDIGEWSVYGGGHEYGIWRWSTDHETDFQWSVSGGGRFREYTTLLQLY